MNRTLLCIGVISIIFAACHKPDSGATASFKLLNNTDNILQVDMYTSSSDRDNRANVAYSYTVPAKTNYGAGQYQILKSKFDSTRAYYFSIYTADYKLSSWGETETAGYMIGGSGGDEFDLSKYRLTTAQYYYLKGNLDVSTWLAVDKVDGLNNSLWNSMSSTDRYKEIVLRKNKTGLIMSKLSDNTVTADTIKGFGVSIVAQTAVLGLITAGSTPAYALYDTRTIPVEDNLGPSSADTLLFHYNTNWWVMVRQ